MRRLLLATALALPLAVHAQTVTPASQAFYGGLGLALAPGSIVLAGGGSGYAAGDTITLTCAGCTITTNPVATVNAVSVGVITGVTVTTPGTLTSAPNAVSGLTFTQTATSGVGSGASFTANVAPIAAGISSASLNTGGAATNGNLYIGAEQTLNGLYGAENTFVGDRAGGVFTGAATANTAIGHDACGIFGAVAPTGSFNTCVGNDAGRNISGTAAANTLVGQNAGRIVSGGFNEFVGESAGSSVTTGAFNLFLGYQVGSTTAVSGQDNVLIGPTGLADLPTASTSNYIGVFGNNAVPVWSATGTNTPSTSVTSIAGLLNVSGGVTSAAANAALGASVTATAQSAFAEGNTSNATGSYSVAMGLSANASGWGSVAIGQDVTADALWAVAIGGEAVTRGRVGNAAGANGFFNVAGDAQYSRSILRGAGSSTGAVRLTADAAAAGGANCHNIPTNAGYSLNLAVMAFDHTTAAKAMTWSNWAMMLTRGAGNAALVAASTPTPLTTGTVAGAAIAATADTTNQCVNISFTPPTGNTDTWDIVAVVEAVEVQ